MWKRPLLHEFFVKTIDKLYAYGLTLKKKIKPIHSSDPIPKGALEFSKLTEKLGVSNIFVERCGKLERGYV